MSIIKLTPQELTYYSQKFSNAANELECINNDISRLVGSLNWEIRSSGSVEYKIEQIASLGKKLISGAESMSNYLNTSANMFTDADNRGAKSIEETTCIFPVNNNISTGIPIIGRFISGVIGVSKGVIGTGLDWLRSVIGIGNENDMVSYNRNIDGETNSDISIIQDIFDLEKHSKTNITNPVPGGVYRGNGYQYGRLDQPTDYPHGHSGIDIQPIDKKTDPNPSVIAAFGGKVSKVGYMPGGYGNYVVIDTIIDGKSCQVFYGHFLDNSIQVKEGDVIDGSTLLAKMGSSGASTGVHLHFEIREYNANTGNYVPIDPIPILNAHNIGFK